MRRRFCKRSTSGLPRLKFSASSRRSSFVLTREFADQDAENFLREIVYERLQAREVYLGKGFAFGKNRGGNIELLRKMSAELGFVGGRSSRSSSARTTHSVVENPRAFNRRKSKSGAANARSSLRRRRSDHSRRPARAHDRFSDGESATAQSRDSEITAFTRRRL